MELITKEIAEAFEEQGDTSEKLPEDIMVLVKFFNPLGFERWYLYDKIDEDIYMAYVNLGDIRFAECGTVSLKEIQSIRLPMGMRIERDIYFGKPTLREVIDMDEERSKRVEIILVGEQDDRHNR